MTLNYKKSHFAWAILALLAVIEMVIVWMNTGNGIETGSDSFFYLSAAKNLLSGAGLGRLSPAGAFTPLTHYPPVYSLVVAAFGLLTRGDVLVASRWVTIVMSGLCVGLVGWACYLHASAIPAAVFGAGIAMLSPFLAEVNIAALSEGTFLVSLLLALVCINLALEKPGLRMTILAAIAVGVNLLTRYSDSGLWVVGILGFLFLFDRPWPVRLKSASIFGLVSILPYGIWSLRNWLLTGALTNRVFSVHWPTPDSYAQAANTLLSWTPHGSFPHSRLILVCACLAAFVLAFIRFRSLHGPAPRLIQYPAFRFVILLVLYGLIYSISLIISRSFVDASTRWDNRILIPLYIVAVLLLIIIGWFVFRMGGVRLGAVLFSLLCLEIGLNYLPQTDQLFAQIRKNEVGVTGPQWKNSPLMQELKDHFAEFTFFTNNTTAIYFNLWKESYPIPEKFDTVRNQVNPDYAQNLAIMQQQLNHPDMALVVFEPYSIYPEYPPINDLTYGLVSVFRIQQGTIYVSQGP